MNPLDLLCEIVRWCDAHADEVEARGVPERAFRDMLSRVEESGRELTDPQRAWVRSIYERLFDTPVYDNAWSSGKVPRGASLATAVPDVLKRPLPLKPPGRP